MKNKKLVKLNKNKRLIILIILILVMQIPTLATTLTDKKNNVKNEIKIQEEKVKKLNERTQKISKEALAIESEINAKDIEINKLQAETIALENEISEKEEESKKIKEEQERNKELLKKRLKAIYKNGNVSYLEMLLTSSDILEMMSSYNMIKEITKVDQKLLSSAEQEKQKLQALAIELETKKESVKQKEKEINSAKIASENLKKKKEEEVAKLNDEGKKAMAEIDELKREEQKIARQIAEYERRKKQQGNGNFRYVGGRLAWPVPSNYKISTEYGVKGKYWFRGYHTGIDIGGGRNTTVVAANDGVVVFAGWNGAYGNCIIIDHGGGLYTLYAHATKLYVASLDKVKRGQAIMGMGETGNAYGVHLHFEVREGSSSYSATVNPMKYLTN